MAKARTKLKQLSPRMGERGSTTLEGVAALVVLSLMITTGLAASYLTFARVWADRSAYEAAVCLASTTSGAICKSNLRSALAYALPIGEVDHVDLRRSSTTASVDFQFAVVDPIKFNVHERLSLPLSSTAGFGGIL